MAKKRSKPRSGPPDMHAVLTGRVQPSLPDLLRLIARTNPTGRQLSPADRDRRYAQKATLQSLLLSRYGDHFRAEHSGEDEVLLRHLSGSKDACHARVSALDEDGRLWVRRSLAEQDQHTVADDELEPDPKAAEGGSGRAPAPTDPLAQAQAALEAWDYDRAEGILQEARRRPALAVEAARLLLDLWVDQLGMDGKAVALGETLATAARQDPGIRDLIALAAARLGRADDAHRWRRGAAQRRDGPLFAALAAQAIEGDELDAAEQALARLRSYPEQSARRSQLEERLASRRAQSRAPAEAACQRLLDEGLTADAQRAARALLARWPKSPVARQVLRAIEQEEAARHAAALAARARAAEAAEDLDVAEARWRELKELGVHGADAELHRVRDQRLRQQAERRQDGVRALLDRDERAGLAAWCRLEQPERTALRDAVGSERADALEEALAVWSQRQAERVVGAVAALEEAERLATQGLDREARAALRRAEKGPRRLRRGRQLQRRLQRRERQEYEEWAWLQLEQAEGLARCGHASQALDALGQIIVADLPAELLALIEEQRSKATGAVLEARWHQLVDKGAWDEADALAEEQTARSALWLARVGQASTTAHDRWQARTWGELDLPVMGHLSKDASTHLLVCVDEDAGTLLIADSLDRLVVVRTVDQESGRVLQRFSFWSPAPLKLVEVWLDHRRLLLVGLAAVAIVDRADWRVLRYRAHQRKDLLDIVPSSDGQTLWATAPAGVVHVVRTDTSAPIKRFDDIAGVCVQRGLPEPRVALRRDGSSVELRGADGGRADLHCDLAACPRIRAFQRDPDDPLRAWGLTATDEPDRPPDGFLACTRVVLDSGSSAALQMDNLEGGGWCQLAPSGDAGRAYFLATNRGGAVGLVAAVDTGDGVSQHWWLALGNSTQLLTDPEGSVVFLETHDGQGWCWVELTEDPPDIAPPGWMVGNLIANLDPGCVPAPGIDPGGEQPGPAEAAAIAALATANTRVAARDWPGALEALADAPGGELKGDLMPRLAYLEGVLSTWTGDGPAAQAAFCRAFDQGLRLPAAQALGTVEGLWGLEPTEHASEFGARWGQQVRAAALAHRDGDLHGAWEALSGPLPWLVLDLAGAALRARIALDLEGGDSPKGAWQRQLALAWFLEGVERMGTQDIPLPATSWMQEPGALEALADEARTALSDAQG